MKKVFYITDCPGSYCELEKDQLMRKRFKIHPDKQPTSRQICPTHGGKIIQRKTTCDRCGKIFYFPIIGPIAACCEPCRNIIHKEDCKEYNKMRKKTKFNPLNPYSCLEFGLCDSYHGCVKPYFPCRMFKVC